MFDVGLSGLAWLGLGLGPWAWVGGVKAALVVHPSPS